MHTSRALHTATGLPNGNVLVVGGEDGRSPTNLVEMYDPLRDTWTARTALYTKEGHRIQRWY